MWNNLDGGAQAVAHKTARTLYPNEVKPKLFFYRTDLFAKAVLDPSTFGDLTTQGWIEMGKELHAKTGAYLDSVTSVPGEGWFDCFVSAYAPIGFSSKSGVYEITTNQAFSESMSFLRYDLKSGVVYPADAAHSGVVKCTGGEQVCWSVALFLAGRFLPETLDWHSTESGRRCCGRNLPH